MAVQRPWIIPKDVKDYTELKEVRERADEKLRFDIARAEQRVIKITHNRFDSEDYEPIPEPVKMATILIAEAFAKNAVESSRLQLKSETFDDYSYTAESSVIDLDSLELEELLSDYVIETGNGKVTMTLRRL